MATPAADLVVICRPAYARGPDGTHRPARAWILFLAENGSDGLVSPRHFAVRADDLPAWEQFVERGEGVSPCGSVRVSGGLATVETPPRPILQAQWAPLRRGLKSAIAECRPAGGAAAPDRPGGPRPGDRGAEQVLG